MEYEHLGTLHEIFQRQACATPDKIAVKSNDGNQVTYRQLDYETDLLAQYLVQIGTIPDSVVGIYMGKSIEYTIAYIAILKAGAAYMPLDMSYPQSLLESIFQDAMPKAVLTLNDEEEDSLKENNIFVISMKVGWQNRIGDRLDKSSKFSRPKSNLDSLAYTVYSSGTTGKPKGIQCPHRGAVFSYTWRHENYPYEVEEREASNIFFVWEMLRPLLRGATLYPIPDNVIYDPQLLTQFLKRHKITRMLFTPSLLEAVLDDSDIDLVDTMKTIRQLWFCGEVVTTALLDRCMKRLSWIRFVNLYSISECHDVAVSDLTLWHNNYPNAATERKFCPVGRVLPGVKVHIMNENMNCQPIGASGEIYVGGHTLARGYLNRPHINAQKFINHGNGQERQRLYRTGDWGYMLADGSLEICGRCDTMVKVRGYSIEIQAIEAAILNLPMVNATVVLVKGEEGDDKLLVAYVVPEGLTTVKEVRSALKRHLPFYMIPSHFVFLKSIPVVKASGKLDKSALPTLDTIKEVGSEGKPQTETEICLAEMWKDILLINTVDVMESFFDLGGHSLLAAKLLSRIKVKFEVELTVRQLFVYPTVSSLSSLIDSISSMGVSASSRRGSNVTSLDQSSQVDLRKEVELHDNFVKSAGNSMRIDMQLRSFWRSVNSGNRWKKGSFLLTGVTGFLGAFILKELLDRTQVHVYCLVRSLADIDGTKRTRNTLEKYGILAVDGGEPTSAQKKIEDEFRSRVEAVEGDIALVNFGLTEEDYQHFTTEIDLIIHAAANVNLIYPYQALHGSNVLGTQNVLLFASTNKIKPLHYISTDAVFPQGLKNCGEDDDVTRFHTKLKDGYSQSKWVAEQLVLQARNRGLPVAVYRLGNMSGESENAFWNAADFNLMMIVGCIETRASPNIDWFVEMTPVDFAAKVIVELSQNILLAMGKIFHIVNTRPLHSSWLFEFLTGQGYKMTRISYHDWLLNLKAHSDRKGCEQQGQLYRTLDNIASDESFFSNMSTYEATNFHSILNQLNMVYPATDRNLLSTYVKNLARMQIIKPPSKALGMRPLEGKVAIVTGASSGIGSAIAKHLARGGASVALAARKKKKVPTVKNAIEEENGTAISILTDVTDGNQVKELVRRAECTLGPISILVNCAGVMYYTLMKNLHEEEWEKQIDINCKSVVNATGAVLKDMISRGAGHIINISSDAGRRGFAGLAVYSGTKFFVEGFSQGLRIETANTGVKVTTIQPGDVKTELLTKNTDIEAKELYDGSESVAILNADDIGRAVVFAASQPDHVAVNEILIEPRGAPI